VTPGTGIKVEPAELRGVKSFGMLCSALDLGWADAADGLAVDLPDSLTLSKGDPAPATAPEVTTKCPTPPHPTPVSPFFRLPLCKVCVSVSTHSPVAPALSQGLKTGQEKKKSKKEEEPTANADGGDFDPSMFKKVRLRSWGGRYGMVVFRVERSCSRRTKGRGDSPIRH
jgi:tRNA-binding EMAP/Myf-like protein